MKKLVALLGAVGSSAIALADGATVSTTSDVITGTNGILPKLQDTIDTVANAAWPFITVIVGIGLLFWLGRAMLRIVRSFFGTAA